MNGVLLSSKFWSKYDTRVNESRPGRQIFWERRTSSNSDDDGDEDVKKKIISAFCKVNYPGRFNGLIQFWAPTDGGQGQLLSTCNQPFSFEDLDALPYWLCCLRNQRRIITHDNAFLNCFPVVVTDLKAYKGKIPLLDKALDCGFTCLILLPVFYPSSSSCVGVVECCMNPSGLVQLFYRLKTALQRVGLTTYDVKQSVPINKTMHRATHEIQEALNIVCQSHHLTLAQVWIPVPSPPSLEDQKRKFVVRLCDYFVDVTDSDYHPDIQTYYDFCGMLPLKIGEGLPGKTLETSLPHFCKNLDDLMLGGSLLGALSCSLDCSCLVISLRNTTLTGDSDYAFEFLWPHSRNHVIVLESLLLTLKRCLPSFNFPSGAQLGDELRLLDVDNSGIRYFNILQGYNASQPPLKQDLEILKSKLHHIYKSNLGFQKEMPVLADYKGNMTFFTLQSPFTLADARDKLQRSGLDLDPKTYTMQYQFEGGKVMLNTDENLKSALDIYLDIPFRLYLQPSSATSQ